MKNTYIKYYTVCFLLCTSLALFAQPSSNNTTGNMEGNDTPPAPINDYIWVLALVGLIIVYLKLKDFQNKKMAQ